MIDSGTPSTTEPTTMPIAPPTPAWPNRVSTILSATRKTATTSIHNANCHRKTSSASATRSKEIVRQPPAPKPARMPMRRAGNRASRRAGRQTGGTTPQQPQAECLKNGLGRRTGSTSSFRRCTATTRTCAPGGTPSSTQPARAHPGPQIAGGASRSIASPVDQRDSTPAEPFATQRRCQYRTPRGCRARRSRAADDVPRGAGR